MLWVYRGNEEKKEFYEDTNYTIAPRAKPSSGSTNIYTGGSAGTIGVYIQPEITKEFTPGDYVYDLEIYISENVYRLVQGKFIVTGEVTR